MKNVFSRFFLRIILPFALALVMSLSQIMEVGGRLWRNHSPVHISFFYAAILFCVFFSIGLWNTLRWGTEAEVQERRRNTGPLVRE
jgi:hypothetical protein